MLAAFLLISSGVMRIASKDAIAAKSTDSVNQKAPAFADSRDHQAGDGWPDQARAIHHGRELIAIALFKSLRSSTICIRND